MGFFKSFTYAFAGIINCILHERNMRFHFCAMLYVIVFSQYYSFSKMQYAIILLLFALVMGAEMINTSIEKLADRVTHERDMNIKLCKDAAAGAVLICAIISAVIGVMFFFDIEVLSVIFHDLTAHPIKLISFVLSLVLMVLFVRFGIGKKK